MNGRDVVKLAGAVLALAAGGAAAAVVVALAEKVLG
jgi:hypothetical protein